jgi:hypothetical protein
MTTNERDDDGGRSTIDEAIVILEGAKDLLKELGWSRQRYVERDESGAPVAFDMVGALQFATVRGNHRRGAYMLAKLRLEESVGPMVTLTGFNRLARNKDLVVASFEAAINLLKDRPGLAKCGKLIEVDFTQKREQR